MKIEYVDYITGCCQLCQGAIFNGAFVINNFRLLCPDCADTITNFVLGMRRNEDEKQVKSYKCSKCGASFDTKGALLAHYRHKQCEEE